MEVRHCPTMASTGRERFAGVFGAWDFYDPLVSSFFFLLDAVGAGAGAGVGADAGRA